MNYQSYWLIFRAALFLEALAVHLRDWAWHRKMDQIKRVPGERRAW